MWRLKQKKKEHIMHAIAWHLLRASYSFKRTNRLPRRREVKTYSFHTKPVLGLVVASALNWTSYLFQHPKNHQLSVRKTGSRVAPPFSWPRTKNQLHQRIAAGLSWPKSTKAFLLRQKKYITSYVCLTAVWLIMHSQSIAITMSRTSLLDQ